MRLSDRTASMLLVFGVFFGSFAIVFPEWLVDTEGRSLRSPDTPLGVRTMGVLCLVAFGSGITMRIRRDRFRLSSTRGSNDRTRRRDT